MSADSDDNAFDVATASVRDINGMLADTGGDIATMEFTGAVGYHHYVATGETHPEYLWKTAFLQAIDDTVLDMVYVDGETPEEAVRQFERQIADHFNLHTSDALAAEFESNLRQLQDTQEDLNGGDDE